MSLGLNNVVKVNYSFDFSTAPPLGGDICLLVTNDSSIIGSVERVRSYSSVASVLADFSSTSQVAKAASAYFANNTDGMLKVASRFDTDQPAQLFGGKLSTDEIEAIKAVSDGSFTISIDNDSQTLTGIDFTTDVTGSDIAARLQNELNNIGSGGYTAASVAFVDDRLVVKSGTTGSSSTITNVLSDVTGTDLQPLLNLQQSKAKAKNGFAGETITGSLAAISNIDNNWRGLTFTNDVRDLVIINGEQAVTAAATYATANKKIFSTASNDLQALDSAVSFDITSVLNNSNAQALATFTIDSDSYPDVAAIAKMFTVDFGQANSTITLNGQKLSGVSAESLEQDQLDALKAKRCNVVADFKGDVIYYGGILSGGLYADELHNVLNLVDELQLAAYQVINSGQKVIYRDEGFTQILGAINLVADGYVSNGALSPGQYDNAGETVTLSKGYQFGFKNFSSTTASDRQARLASFNGTCLLSGAVHNVVISLSAAR